MPALSSRRRAWGHAAFSVALATALAVVGACRAPTEITVEIQTNVNCADVKGTSITIGNLADLDARPATTVTAACNPSTGRIGSIVIVPSGESRETVAIRIVMGVGKDLAECVPPAYGPGCIVARRALRYVPNASLSVPIFMAAVCTGIACNSTQTCVGGDCASATIEDSTRCLEPGGCTEAVLGPVTPGDPVVDAGGPAPDASVVADGGDPTIPMDPVAQCGRPSTYIDDFTAAALGPEWLAVAGAGASVATSGGQLVLATAAVSSARLESRFAVNLADDRLRAEVPSVPATNTDVVLAARAVNGDELAFVARDGVLTMRRASGAVDATTVPYDPIAHRWWQIVEAAGQVRWETSPDATTWTQRKSTPTPAFARVVHLVLESRSTSSAAEVRFDRLNAGRPRAPWCKTSTLVDDFNDAVPGPQFTGVQQGACSHAENAGAVRFTMTGAGPTSLCAYGSASAYDLRGSAVYIDIPAITTFYVPVRFFLRVIDASGRSAALAFVGTNQLSESADGLAPQLTAYASGTEGWWRLREAAGTLYWETSANGTLWVVKRQAPAPFPLDAVRVLIGCETNATMPGAIGIGVPRLNIGP